MIMNLGIDGFDVPGPLGSLDMDSALSVIDSTRYPGWKDVKWSYADLKPGDCFLADFHG